MKPEVHETSYSEPYNICKYCFSIEIEIPEKECNDDALQILANKASKKLYELPEFQKLYPNFEDFDNLFELYYRGTIEEEDDCEEYY